MPLICLGLLGAATGAALDLEPATLAAYEKYVAAAEKRIDKRVRLDHAALWLDEQPGRRERARQGEILVEPVKGDGQTPVRNGLIHDWIGAMFIPGATLQDTLSVVNDYDDYKHLYKPGIMDSKLLDRNGNDYDFYLRLRRKDVLAVVVNTRHKARCQPVGGARWLARTYSTYIAEVRDPGEPTETELPAGTGRGFLWRLNSFTRFEERDGGVYIELESIALSRNVPFLLRWIVQPIIMRVARESMANALGSTRGAVLREAQASAMRRTGFSSPKP